MSCTPEQLESWNKVLDILHSNMPEYSFTTWFKPLRLHAVTNEALVIACDNAFVLQHIKNRYRQELFNCVHMCFGRSYELDLKTQDEIKAAPDPVSRTLLNPKYTFDTFVVGPSNSFACAAALAVAEEPSTVYNPLFIYGSAGLGKTHLLNAIGNYIMSSDPNRNVLFTTSESITNELIDSITKKKGTAELRARMRSVDVLIVDDIQFMARTKTTQEEFFHTFNDLHSQGKQIILASDRPPKDIPTIEDRLRSRFEWGLIVDIQKPDYETRVAILRRKALEDGIDVPYDVLDYIADRVDSNIRELEGSLTRLNAQCKLMGVPINLDTATVALAQLVRQTSTRRVTPELIMRVICEQYDVSQADMVSKKRSRDVALPRQIAMYLCREMTQMSTTGIGNAFGGRDHTTVLHGCDKIAEDMRGDISFRNRIEELMKIIREG